ncbi:aminotransferase class I/II-fold pyridoxal phosphate-dependent enzyme [Pontibacter sp. G13]|uniref:trans-sulfuration enzyme family protein n=1 Tax=Pontibacter sp. G13 TaxID=3074898 RepID=UPI00288BA87C|nr:aminotransferase class I/II-fold pyridoxal phosphate-dependent enzyme [Pontibacter sp. G13]WNJ20829.1 aminotransferase class I/II-fold pyridoxal phosphate-dependent enzyme [Pontibacter sp. G13]
MDLSYIINHLGEEREQYFGAAAPPIMQSSNFAFPTVDEMRKGLTDEMGTPFYTRGHNPTVAILRKKLAALEAAEDCLVFASGSAAIGAAVMSCVESGDHVVCVQKPYSWTAKLLSNMLSRYGIETTYVDGRNTQEFAEAVRENTKLFMLESPNSMTFELQDIEAITTLAKSRGIATIMDNSFSTPLNQQPITLGVDIVVHSASKYLNGHSDIVAGVLCASAERTAQIFASEFMTLGGIISPNDAWLMLRGLRTLPIRMERVAQSTPKIVEFLESHPAVKKVYYPFSASFPQRELAEQQMKAPTGQFSIELQAAHIGDVERFCNHLKYFLLACSWGGYESLAFPMAALYGSANYGNTSLPWNLVRFYIGLEDADVLIKDLEEALALIPVEA